MEFSPSIIENYSGTAAAKDRETTEALDSLINVSNNSQSSGTIQFSASQLTSTNNATHPTATYVNTNSPAHVNVMSNNNSSHSNTTAPTVDPGSISVPLNRLSHGLIGNAREIGLRGESPRQDKPMILREAGVQLVPPQSLAQQVQQEPQFAPVLKRSSQDGRNVETVRDGDIERDRKTLKKKPNIQIKPNEPLVDSLAPSPQQQVNHSPALISLAAMNPTSPQAQQATAGSGGLTGSGGGIATNSSAEKAALTSSASDSMICLLVL
jgi:hypothetical protein